MPEPPRKVTPELHSAGATVLHKSPFSGLEVPVSTEPLLIEIRDRWVVPFYNDCLGNIPAIEAGLAPQLSEITPSLVLELLSQFNWRPRLMGAVFVALRRFEELEELIGRLLLRSDVCYAGRGYCVALARLNTPTSAGWLREYLGYYLTRPELWFDQADAMAALLYLDQTNHTDHASELRSLWNDFVVNKPNWDLDDTFRRFAGYMEAIEAISLA